MHSTLLEYERRLAKRETIEQQVQEIDAKLKKCRKEQDTREKTIQVLKMLVETMFEKNIKKVEALVSFGLQEVFYDRNLKVKIVQEERRGILNLDVLTVDEEENVEGIASKSFGGAVVQVQSFLLLVVFLILLDKRRMLFLDEKFSNVSQEYQENVGKLIRDLCRKFSMKVLLVTHNKEILPHADVILRADLIDGELKLIKES